MTVLRSIDGERRDGCFEKRFSTARLIIYTAISWTLVACATRPLLGPEVQQTGLSERVELTQTPFFPQDDYQCGPAALATVLTDSGVDVTPDALVPSVYLPGRRGSLQIELLAATRKLGRVPYVIQPALDALLAEVAAQRPTLVLQNLGVRFAPVWHYAVVVGYDANADRLILRSGITERHVVSAAKFARTWAGGDRWAMVVLRPGELPEMPVQSDYLAAVAELERLGNTDAAIAAYRAAVYRWPRSGTPYFGLANAYYAAGQHREAEQAYRESLERAPDNIAARNNLANALLNQGRCYEAAREIQRALARQKSEFQNALADTGAQVESRCTESGGSSRR